MSERILQIAGDGRRTLASHELRPLKRVQPLLSDPLSTSASTVRGRARTSLPTTAASWTSSFCSGSSRSRRAAIRPCTVSGSRSSWPRSRSMRDELLGVERVAARARAAAPPEVSAGRSGALEQLAEESRGVVVRERRQRDRERVRLAAAPAGPAGQQLGPRGADEEQRHAARPLDQVVDEVEQVVVGPVEVLEHEHERPLVGEPLEEAAPGGERLLAPVTASLCVRRRDRPAAEGATRSTGRQRRHVSFRAASPARRPRGFRPPP